MNGVASLKTEEHSSGSASTIDRGLTPLKKSYTLALFTDW